MTRRLLFALVCGGSLTAQQTRLALRGNDPRASATPARRFPGFGICTRCRAPWSVVKPHMTEYDGHHSCFCLCTLCWSTLATPQARLPYYYELYNAWRYQATTPQLVRENAASWPAIRAAVMEGK